MARSEDEARGIKSSKTKQGSPREDSAAPASQPARQADAEPSHRLRAAFEADFDDADADSCTVTRRRNDKISDS
jgi:hypothetical protein